MRTRRRWRIAARVVGILGLPVTLSLLLMLVFAFVPMWLVAFEVENASGQALTVTPIGVVDATGTRSLLPIKVSSRLNLPALTVRGFALAPGERLRIVYDFDDIQLAEIVVVPASGPARTLVVDPEPTHDGGSGAARRLVPDPRARWTAPGLGGVADAARRAPHVLAAGGLRGRRSAGAGAGVVVRHTPVAPAPGGEGDNDALIQMQEPASAAAAVAAQVET